MVRDPESLAPAPEEATDFVNRMRNAGVLLSTDGVYHNVVKIKPPMVLSEKDVDDTLEKMDSILSR